MAKDARNGWKKLTGQSARKPNAKKTVEQTIGAAVANGGQSAGLRSLDQALTEAQTAPDAQTLHYLATALERLGEFPRAYKLRAQGHELLSVAPGQPWEGQPLPDGNLVITPMRYDRQSIHYAIQYASMIGLAAERAPGCKVYLEPRLIPMFSRSFPTATFLNEDDMPEDVCAPDEYHAGLERLPALFATSEQRIAAAHRPILADLDLSESLRARYAPDGKPLIGIAWGSLNSRKDVPSFDAWARLLNGMDAHFISLQYGDVAKAKARVERAGSCDVLVDPQIDQFVDMDGFAAQLSAVDLIVTISNSGAHLAGAMGRPMIVLLDDRFHLSWPYFQDHTPWYPDATLVRRNGRDWEDVMQSVRATVSDWLSLTTSR
ncbi:hypothetical protein GTA44_11245 [Roseobacter sp. HKCCD9056]|uniref:hypothetical protein n=1 Tax=unclassified Roseobacter TaxID=196798 RepID=UPI0014930A89|nr:MULTISPECIES: hypothetical protein [unclassified Roseobacter]NNV30706.1 hypothetical protein [Roseobacter sp. HKCCD9061]NNV68785.1 hypothetical protein [Roseobacter sp. HKCCD8474]NNX09392.1 hypothetical protein [Roseobacter sp. HKCCD9032]NNY29007.1 hypothetical protein [Roseobacter sp. HKCCD9199]NOC32487.1 hypothetical protein [Roseobacter sp. HKCCD8482]NPU50294.1 hypothetical protein [Roseobacter sp. HKCCD6565]